MNTQKSKTTMKLKDRYLSSTPTKFRKLGDALLGVSTMITSFAIYEEAKWVAISALLIGVVGKFLSNFFTEETA